MSVFLSFFLLFFLSRRFLLSHLFALQSKTNEEAREEEKKKKVRGR